MLSFNIVEVAFLLFSAATYAQSTNHSAPVWRVVLTTPEQVIAGLTACTPSASGWFVNGGVEITVLPGFSPKAACYNVADLFTPSGKTPRLECYPSNSTCDFKLQEHSNYNATADYSHVGFQTGLSPGKDGSLPDTSALTFRTFEGADCASDANHTWNQWSCNTYIGDCSVLPYSVRSFSISATPEANKTECYVSSERGESRTPYEEGVAVRVGSGSAVVALAVALGVAFLG